MSKNEVGKKINLIKKNREKKYSNQLGITWLTRYSRYKIGINSQKKSRKNNETQGLITQCHMMILKNN
jgi:hypothetical protein